MPERKNIRLKEYDYGQTGAYAITICVRERRHAFGRVKDGVMALNPFGRIALENWLEIPDHAPHGVVDEFIIMPNHVHGILFIEGEMPPTPEEEAQLRQFGKPLSGSVSSIIGLYKGSVSRKIGELRGARTKAWQPRFYDHIIRHDRDLQLQRAYIENNPSQWAKDEFNTL